MTTTPVLDELSLGETFRAESAENIDAMEQALLSLEGLGRADDATLQLLLRAAHTLKGNSAIMGYQSVTAAAHQFEDELLRLQNGTTACTPALISRLLESADELRALVANPGSLPSATRQARATLRVDVTRLDRLLDLTGEIAIAPDKERLDALHRVLREEVMRLRMVPLAAALEAQHRTARDAAARLGREVRVIIEGGDVEVDTAIAEQMRDPLTHMVRNAVDHGIEPPHDRLAAGKPACGTIIIRAEQEGGAAVITVTDDGRGIDRAKIGATSDAEVLERITASGFSTAAEVTEVSGRGVGMDVVRQRVEALRGSIVITSSLHHGTKFTIRLPLTVAIMNGFIVMSGGERYVLPLEVVEECFDPGTALRAQHAQGLLDLRGASLPWISLDAALSARTERTARSARPGVVVVRHSGKRIGLVVDGFEGDCQVVIKPLSGVLRHLTGIAGSTILDDGRAALILNVPQLVESVHVALS